MKSALDELRKCEDEGLIMPKELFAKLTALEKFNPKVHGLVHRTMTEGVMKIGEAGPHEAFRFTLYRGIALGFLMALDDLDIRKKSRKDVKALLKELFKSKKEDDSNAQPRIEGK